MLLHVLHQLHQSWKIVGLRLRERNGEDGLTHITNITPEGAFNDRGSGGGGGRGGEYGRFVTMSAEQPPWECFPNVPPPYQFRTVPLKRNGTPGGVQGY